MIKEKIEELCGGGGGGGDVNKAKDWIAIDETIIIYNLIFCCFGL